MATLVLASLAKVSGQSRRLTPNRRQALWQPTETYRVTYGSNVHHALE